MMSDTNPGNNPDTAVNTAADTAINPGSTVSLCIMSGKGGVGKTNLALNLGLCLRDLGHKLLLMDCDLGLANLDVLLGLTPEKNLQDLLGGGVEPADVLLHVEDGLDILPAASGVPELVEMDQNQRDALFGAAFQVNQEATTVPFSERASAVTRWREQNSPSPEPTEPLAASS